MQYIDFSVHAPHPTPQAPAAAQATPAKGDDSWFDDLVDVVNPLQHLPVVGTLYRALSGDQIKTPEKIAGDTLYGGVWGFVSSVADTAFQSLTGKNVGDTVLAFLTGEDDAKPTPVAEVPKSTAAAATASDMPKPDVSALETSLSHSGADNDMAQRAVYAYRRANGLSGAPLHAPF